MSRDRQPSVTLILSGSTLVMGPTGTAGRAFADLTSTQEFVDENRRQISETEKLKERINK